MVVAVADWIFAPLAQTRTSSLNVAAMAECHMWPSGLYHGATRIHDSMVSRRDERQASYAACKTPATQAWVRSPDQPTTVCDYLQELHILGSTFFCSFPAVTSSGVLAI